MTERATSPTTEGQPTDASGRNSARKTTAQPARGLNTLQREWLLKPLDAGRVRTLDGMAHLEAWDIRRWLTRIFGFGGWAYTTDVELVAEHRKDDHRKRNRDGQEYGPSYTAWTVVYRSKVRLEIRDAHGNELSYFEEYAAGDAVNQPRLGDAHDFALKTAESQALKRAAVNLGDQFGLALYDKGGHIVDHPDTGRKVVRGVVAATLDRFAQQAPDEDPPVQGGELDDMANAA